jgi:hypothetical protein
MMESRQAHSEEPNNERAVEITSFADNSDHDRIPSAPDDQEHGENGPGALAKRPDQIWQLALDGGDLKAVYSQLVELAAQRTPSEIGFARLYWLLKFHPDFDAGRDPVEWLIQGLGQHGLRNLLLTILSIDVGQRSGNVPAVLVTNLFAEGDPASSLVEIAHLRWFVARRLFRFEVIADDIEQLRRRFLDESRAWQRLLVAATRRLTMVPSESALSLLASVRQEVESTPADFDSMWVWDTYETNVALHEAWVKSGHVSIRDVGRIAFENLNGERLTKPNLRTRETLSTLGRLISLVEATWVVSTDKTRASLLSL